MDLAPLIIIALLIIPVYLLCHLAIRKLKIGNSDSRNYIAIIPTLIISPILYLGLILIWMFSASYYPRENFDKIKWHFNNEERFKMSEDIIESKILIGKNKEEIINLLGSDYTTSNESHISYYLGHVPGFFNIDPDVLTIYFEEGSVIKVCQYEA
ncbi:MAG: hypothetical protein QNJ57_06960 [Flavobacteriaceae bacterium]|nr:hypothetical protein [Flavobacteriaceae bacterium]